jgi:hypothetical protein
MPAVDDDGAGSGGRRPKASNGGTRDGGTWIGAAGLLAVPPPQPEQDASRPLQLKQRVEVLELDTGILGCELPIGLGVMAIVLPGRDFIGELLFVGDTAVEAFATTDQRVRTRPY